MFFIDDDGILLVSGVSTEAYLTGNMKFVQTC